MDMKVSRSIRALSIALAIAAVGLLTTSTASAQSSREQARRYYQEGVALFNQGQYLPAVQKYKKADALAPAPLLDFNIGLAYDRAGQSSEALKHYRSYLKRAPRARNRAAVRAKINRIEGEARAAAAKAAEDAAAAKAAEDAAAAKAAEDAAAAKAAEDAAAAATRPAVPVGPAGDPGAEPAEPAAGAVVPPADRTPAAAKPLDPFATTGDPELDNVSGIDVTAIRERRNLSSPSSGRAANRGPAAGPAPRSGRAAPAPRPMDQPKKKSKPVYKQWWFWVVVGVSAIILIDIASTGDSSTDRPSNRLFVPMDRARAAPQGGAVMLRF